MTVYFPRHELNRPDPERYAEQFNEYLVKRIDKLETSSAVIDGTFQAAVMYLRARCLVDPPAAKAETWDAAVNAMQMGSALFAATGVSEGTIECRINRRVRRIPAIGTLPTANAGAWLSAFWLAVICREPDRMTQLCEIPVDRLRVTEGIVDEYIYHWVDTLQTYWLQRPGLVEKLTATLNASHPDVATVAPRDLLDGVLYPPINLFYRFVRRDVEGFSPALEEALHLHRAYWTATEERSSHIDGALPLGPLAIACWAYDGKLPINVESEYLPKHLLQHDWLGEYPT
ncbi:immunity 49 family protein [Streptomyces sp. DH24]|uniref:immunity 49 family protein n=1 Tax=Streptomyces sp. DH24 TaxID=3040123 RepID=UPI002441A6B5|nr:immunity 49 family protein [Streptomyces sp. DH24]MDG9718720.1 immunity 49 family protein [Streptomyces sp. DH24]